MLTSLRFYISGVFTILALTMSAQSAKKLCDAAQKLEKNSRFNEAIDNYSKAIETDSTYSKAFIMRAACFEKVNKKSAAISDYRKVASLEPKEKEWPYKAGMLLMETAMFVEADPMFRKAISLDRRYREAIEAEIKVLHELRNFEYGLQVTQLAIEDKRNAVNYYNHAVMHDSLKRYAEAEKFYKNAISDDSKFTPAYVGLSFVLIKLGKFDEAMTNCQSVLDKEPANMDALFARSIVSANKKDLQNALNDITKVILTKPSIEAYKQRASCYEILGQMHNVVSDYTQLLKMDDGNIDAHLKRAHAYESIRNTKSALEDYNKVVTLASGNEKLSAMSGQAAQKIYDLSRESDKPEIEITSLKPDQNIIKISADKTEIIIKGVIKDASLIKNMNVNTGTAIYSQDSLNPGFAVKITDLSKVNELTISATDVYNNTKIIQYKIEKTESDKPVIAIESPYTSPDFEITLDVNGTDLYLQGKIKDASLIESINIDGVIASFNPTTLNPDFTAQVKIEGKEKITFTVRDIYGNENVQAFTINRAGLTASIDNPMGNTWVIFIENSKYDNFPSLEGPTKDVLAMKSALANYKVTKIITQKNMSKVQMEKFFSIDLRDYVKNNHINSLLIWYAGHGKYVSPTGYWVPSDGKLDDEFSYFGINNLKAAMQSYSGKLLHTLVITDACESGATFLMAMRGGDDDKSCSSWELTRSKSSQVFTSAGYELASDNSQFTKTFVSCLNNNVEPCLAIDKIVKKVTVAVSKAGNQAPKFGKIKDLEDEGGTYFFVKK